jgi:hypothetical protein
MQTLEPPVSPRRELVVGLLQLGAGLFFLWLFYERYWRWRDCIAAALSSCVTPDGESLTEGGMLWSPFAVAFVAAGAIRLARRLPR